MEQRQASGAGLTRAAMDRVIDDHYLHEGRDDVEAVLATLSDDVQHDVVGAPSGPVRGKDKARAFYEGMFADLAQEQVTSLRRYYGADFVVDESLWRGTAVGAPMGFAGRGRPVAFRILHLFEFAADGAIARENVWMDLAAIAGQLRDTPPDAAKDVVRRFYEAFDGHALRGFDAIHPAFEARVFGATVLDWAGFVAFGEAFLAGFPNGQHIFDVVTAEGDVVTTVGRYRGRHDREFMGVPATGREVDFAVMHIDRLREGRIVEHRGLGDINTMWAQLGVEPPRPR